MSNLQLVVSSLGLFTPPIDRLPAELLVHIFDALILEWEWDLQFALLCRIQGVRKTLPPHWTQNVRSLVSITHVCRRWRAVASGTAHLWTHFDDVAGRMSTFLERSNLLPLFVMWQKSAKAPTPFFSQVLAPRLRGLCMDVPSYQSDTALSMPSLEVLMVFMPLIYEPLKTDAPSLRALAICICPHATSFWPLPGTYLKLTHLQLICSAMPFNAVEALYEFLATCTALEAIHIRARVFSNSWNDFPGEPASLPQMRAFWLITDYLTNAGAFVSRFVFPEACRVLLHRSDRIFDDVLDLPANLSLATAGKFVHMREDRVTERGMRIQVTYRGGLHEHWCADFYSKPATLRVSLKQWDDLPKILARATELTTLALATQSANDAEAMLGALARSPIPSMLRTLSVQGAGLVGLPRTTWQELLDGVSEAVSVLIDPGEVAREWVARFGARANVAVAAGAGLCRWDEDEKSFWETDRALQTQYWSIAGDEEPCVYFPW